MLGKLFKQKSVDKNRTELVMLIVPYIIESDERATEVSRAVMDRFTLLDFERALGPQPLPPPGPAPAPAPPPRGVPATTTPYRPQ